MGARVNLRASADVGTGTASHAYSDFAQAAAIQRDCRRRGIAHRPDPTRAVAEHRGKADARSDLTNHPIREHLSPTEWHRILAGFIDSGILLLVQPRGHADPRTSIVRRADGDPVP